MKPFFTPEDFKFNVHKFPTNMLNLCEQVAEIANAKIEREGKVVYGAYNYVDSHGNWTSGLNKTIDTHKALLINIEPIEKCEHPVEKIKINIVERFDKIDGNKIPVYKNESYICECGARVKPLSFGACDSEAEEVR